MREAIRDKGRLEHILQAIDNILEYTKDVQSIGELEESPIRKHATIYNVQIIGEAVYNLSKEFKTEHAQTPWKMIEKTRHVLVHDYYQVETAILWSIITEDLSPLKEQVTEYLKEFI